MVGNWDEASLQSKLAIWLATGVGVGLISPAPGTIGGLWGLLLAWVVGLLPSASVQLLVIAVITLASVPICSAASRALGGGKDPGAIVLDEIVALPIVFLGVEAKNWMVWLAGWFLFRIFDITKPPPIRRVERWQGGWGIVADDCIAAAEACIVLHGLLWLDRTAAWGFLTPIA